MTLEENKPWEKFIGQFPHGSNLNVVVLKDNKHEKKDLILTIGGLTEKTEEAINSGYSFDGFSDREFYISNTLNSDLNQFTIQVSLFTNDDEEDLGLDVLS